MKRHRCKLLMNMSQHTQEGKVFIKSYQNKEGERDINRIMLTERATCAFQEYICFRLSIYVNAAVIRATL